MESARHREPGTLVDHPVWQDHDPTPFCLALEGGAMRCQFTAGVLDCMLDRGLLAQLVVGVSAGAAVGFSYASGATGRSCYMNMKYAGDWRFFSLRSRLLTGSTYGGPFIFDTIPNKLEHIDYSWFGESPIRFVSVASCLEDGQAAYHEFDDSMDVKRGSDCLVASTSMPLVSAPVLIDGKHYLDGGICDSIPFGYARREYARMLEVQEDSADKVPKQVIVLSRPREHRLRIDRIIELERRRYRKWPRFIEACERRLAMHNAQYDEIERMHDAGEAYAIWPEQPIEVGMMEKNPDKLLAAWMQGYEQLSRQWAGLEHYMGR